MHKSSCNIRITKSSSTVELCVIRRLLSVKEERTGRVAIINSTIAHTYIHSLKVGCKINKKIINQLKTLTD